MPQLVLRFGAAGTPPPPPPPAPEPATVVCGQVLTASTLVQNDLLDCLGEGLIVGAPNIVVDLGGHTVDSGAIIEPGEEDGLLAGIRNSGHANVVIRNGTVQGFGYGVRLLGGARYNVVEDLTLLDNVNAGVELFDADDGGNGNVVRDNDLRRNGVGVALAGGSENSVVERNTFTGNLGFAVHLLDASGHRIESNVVSGLTGDPLLDSDGGIRLEGGRDTVVRGNTISDAGDAGITVTARSHRNLVEGNTVSRTSDSGISVADSDGNQLVDNVTHRSGGAGIGLSAANDGVVRGNDVRFNPGGIALAGSNGNVVEGNDTTGSTASGITVESGSGNRIAGNLTSGTRATGIAVEGESLDANGTPTGNTVEANTANENLGSGITVGGAGHTVTGNAAYHNAAWGIDAAAGTADGGGNTASGNGEPPQCRGVICAAGTAPPVSGGDLTRPDTTLTGTPPNPSSSMSVAEFTFTGTDDTAPTTALRFQCRLDAPPDRWWTWC